MRLGDQCHELRLEGCGGGVFHQICGAKDASLRCVYVSKDRADQCKCQTTRYERQINGTYIIILSYHTVWSAASELSSLRSLAQLYVTGSAGLYVGATSSTSRQCQAVFMIACSQSCVAGPFRTVCAPCLSLLWPEHPGVLSACARMRKSLPCPSNNRFHGR